MVRTDFWKNPIALEEMTPEDKYFYLYLLTNSNTTQIGIYRMTKKQMAFDLGYSIETVQSLMERFIEHHKLIRYNPITRELAIKNWGKDNLQKGGKPVMDCMKTELKDVEDTSLISYVAEAITKEEIRSLYESFCKHDVEKEISHQADDDTYPDNESDEVDDPFIPGDKVLRQQPSVENNLEIEDQTQDVKEIVEFWDHNGFGLSNMNGKQQLLSWLENSSFLQPKEVILKAMAIACANNKRKLNYVVGILKNWENESLLTAREIDSYHENQKSVPKNKHSTESFPAGRAIPDEVNLDLSAGEDW
ncbi:DnaD domain protein [Metabacillus sediminilitoris]|uniref:DnaD domain protein n=2 Tax=Metabacillus sediminilitoris TaxID=2567941 RepID=A0A4S4BWI7_9BACI|nr:DnaD domain protein [Metabacillus sediminilitoris]THF79440.1 DnaD domain protein [Metabacillus sediminilitoris]